MREDVTYLAADEREGRGPGTRGIDEAADYISFVFKSSGLKPVPGAEGYFQPFPLSGFPAPGKDQELAFAGPEGKQVKGLYKGDFTPLAIGATAKPREVPIVFAGYGITAKDDSLKLEYDDYADVDVKNKAVLIIRREPQEGNAKSPVRRLADDPIRHLPAQGHQRLPAWRGGHPARQRPGRGQGEEG